MGLLSVPASPCARVPCGGSYPISHEDPGVQRGDISTLPRPSGRGRVRTQATCHFPSHAVAGFPGWLGTAIPPGSLPVACMGSAQGTLGEDSLLSVEYDELLAHGLQALLEVSVLSESRERRL